MFLYILGAGASAQDKVPITSELIDKAFWKFGGQYDGTDLHLLGAWDKDIAVQNFKPVFEVMDQFYGTDFSEKLALYYREGCHPSYLNISTTTIEDFLTRLHRMERGYETYGLHLSQEQASELNANARFFYFHTLCYESGIRGADAKYYPAFVEHALKNDSHHCIITLNYDLLLEEALHKHMQYVDGKWVMAHKLNWTYGFPFGEISCTVPHGFQDETTARIHYLKLHGSFNWGYCREHKATILHSIRSDAQHYYRFHTSRYKCHTKDHISLHVLIPPITEKEIELPCLRNVWDQARSSLRNASEIHIIGYSLPDADQEAQTLLRENCSKDVTRVVIANPTREHREKLKTFLPVSNTRIQEYGSFQEYLHREYDAAV